MAAHRRDARRLGEAVAGHDRLEAELGAHAPDQLDRHRRRARHREPQRRHVELGEARVVEDRLVDGRRSGQHRDVLLGGARHHRVDVEHRVRDDRRALDEARDDARVQPERVEERVDDEVAVVLAQPDDRRPRVVRAHRRAVREHRALRAAGRARREQDRRTGRRRATVGQRAPAVVAARNSAHAGAAEVDDLAQRRDSVGSAREQRRRSSCRGSR